MSVGFFGTAVAVGSLLLVDTAPDRAITSGFFWRYEDVPETLKQPVELCWSFVGGTGVTPLASAVTVQLPPEVPPPVTSPNDR